MNLITQVSTGRYQRVFMECILRKQVIALHMVGVTRLGFERAAPFWCTFIPRHKCRGYIHSTLTGLEETKNRPFGPGPKVVFL
jgi:hypothetical protein